MREPNRNTLTLLREMVCDGQLGLENARNLESSILLEFPGADGDERFAELLEVLASYTPGGGDYLYDEATLVEEARRVLHRLENRPETTSTGGTGESTEETGRE